MAFSWMAYYDHLFCFQGNGETHHIVVYVIQQAVTGACVLAHRAAKGGFSLRGCRQMTHIHHNRTCKADVTSKLGLFFITVIMFGTGHKVSGHPGGALVPLAKPTSEGVATSSTSCGPAQPQGHVGRTGSHVAMDSVCMHLCAP